MPPRRRRSTPPIDPPVEAGALTRWLPTLTPDQEVVGRLMAETRQPAFICNLLAQRGVKTADDARRFLAPRIDHLHDPTQLRGVPDLVARLIAARDRGATIGIHGDYDVDGITSTALYTRALRDLGFRVLPFVPHRMVDGYGVSGRALQQFVDAGASVVLTCDTGFSAVEEVRRAVDELGLEVLVTDHHQPPAVLPKAHALVNPQQPGCTYPNKNLCGVGVAFKVLQALCRALGRDEREVLYPYLDLVALGTVCDVVALTDENRVFARYGVQVAKKTRSPGLRALFEAANVDQAKISEHTFGWIVGPRINASGRVGDAALALQALLTDNYAEAQALANELQLLNVARKEITAAIETDAIRQLEGIDLSGQYGIVLAGSDAPGATRWHHGVIGIVASRLVERTGRPVFLFARDEATGQWKGSGRAPNVGTVDLFAALEACKSPHLAKHGGHAHAAGATLHDLSADAPIAFGRAFDAAVRTQMTPEDRVPVTRPDIVITLDQLTQESYELMKRFAPFGHGNEAITAVARGVSVTSLKSMGEGGRHLRLTVTQNGKSFTCVGWGLAERVPDLLEHPLPFPVDLCFRFRENTFRGRPELQLEIVDVAPGRTRLMTADRLYAVMEAATTARPHHAPPVVTSTPRPEDAVPARVAKPRTSAGRRAATP